MRVLNRIGIISVLFFVVASYGCGRKSPADDQVVASINNYQLTVDDFKNEAGLVEGNKSLSSDPAKAKQELLQDMITKKVLIQEAQKLNFDKRKSFMKEIERYWEQALLKLLIKNKSDEFNRTTLISLPEVKERYRRMGKRFYTQMLTIDERSAADKLSSSFENFDALKNAYQKNIISEHGPEWRGVGDLPLAVENALYAMSVGQISAPIAYSGGWIVIRVLREDALILEPLDKMANQIASDLLVARKRQALEDWIEQARNKASIKVNNEVLNKIDLNRRADGK